MSGPASGSSNPNHDELLAQFVGVTGADADDAISWLSANGWDVGAAARAWEAHENENYEDQVNEYGDNEENNAPPGGGRTLGGGSGSAQPSGAPATSTRGGGQSSSGPSKPAQKKIATLGDLASAPSGPADDDDNSDDDQDFFAGGEKSALAVQNPDELKRKILEKARRTAPRPGGDDPPPAPSHFTGSARTLGGDDAPSRMVDDPDANVPQPAERIERRLHFWENGFSVDDGELYDTSLPQNARILDMIRSGRAPLDIMGVNNDQEVDVKIEQHDSPYVAPKKKYKPFSGGGQRLGSPTPGISQSSHAASSASTTPAGDAAAAATSTTSASGQPKVDVDESQPTLNLQIRLGDGSRLVSRFNSTHTVGDVYTFVHANSASGGRNYTLMTTFPSKELSDHSLVLGDSPELKKGGTVIQKWT